MKKQLFLLSVLFCFARLQAQCPISVAGTNTICSGSNTTLTATGATSYTWSTGETSYSVSVSPTVTTTYTVVGSGGSCKDSAIVTITVNQPPTLSTNGPQTICPGNVATLGVSGAITYSWFPSFYLSASTGSYVASSPPSNINYSVCGTDANGCTSCTSVMVFVVPAPNISVSVTPASCGQCNGTGTIIANGGTPPYTYYWTTGLGSTPFAQNICAGSYSVSVMDAAGCAGWAVANIPQVNTASLITTVIPAACGQNDGSIKIDTVMGGVPPYIYLQTVNGTTSSIPNPYTHLAAGIYYIGVADSTGCTTFVQVTVNNSNFTAQLNPVPPSCNSCNGSLSTAITGGTAPYKYSWSNNDTTGTIGNLCAGHYQLSITDSSGCFTSTGIQLTSPSAPQISIDSITNISCNGMTTGAATISAAGGIRPYTYLWNTTPAQTDSVASGLQAGLYTVKVTDNTGCYSTQYVYIANSNNIYVYPTAVNAANCSANGSATVSAVGGISPYTYSWSNGTSGAANHNLAANIYSVTATDAHGCQGYGYVTVYGQCLNTIKGRVYSDLNQNCMQDAGESGLQYISVSANGYYANTDANGDYSIQTPNLNNTVVAYPYSQQYYTALCPVSASINVTIPQAGDTSAHNDFAYYVNPNYVDVGIHPGWSPSSPGSSKTYWFLYWNNGPTPQNAVVTLTYDSLLQYVSCTQGGVQYPAQHKIEWTFNNLAPGSYWNWTNRPQAFFNVPVTVSLNDTLHTHYVITPLSNDVNPSDNTLDNAEPVTGSHDPNEKTVYPQGNGATGNILPSDSVLFYTIHFQNNGNDTAYRVVVVDTLSPFLDPATVIPGAANHPYKFSISGKGVLNFVFDSIMLPDSLTNEQASIGSLNFTVKQKANNPFGSVIKNTAGIYFDYNTAVYTNTTVNTITAPSVIKQYKKDGLLIFPNPANGILYVELSIASEGSVISLFDITGRKVLETGTKKQERKHEIDVRGLSPGMYLLEAETAAGVYKQKVFISR